MEDSDGLKNTLLGCTCMHVTCLFWQNYNAHLLKIFIPIKYFLICIDNEDTGYMYLQFDSY